ncbi:MAG: hypothetical protein LBE08_10585 [Bifidobacteriaceae bacterium]|jgi:hypothetical protein|nr:hypothetical protein [Bifidobacteriaceae bacterium]
MSPLLTVARGAATEEELAALTASIIVAAGAAPSWDARWAGPGHATTTQAPIYPAGPLAPVAPAAQPARPVADAWRGRGGGWATPVLWPGTV